ncbi:MAG: hypothetical protein ACTSU7_00520 [Candidatus Heimdallarchaeaceae archaeon]
MPADFDRCVRKVKAQLMKDKGLSSKEAESSAYAICTAAFKKAGKPTREEMKNVEITESKEKKLDEYGNIIVAENVKLFIDSEISVVEE